MLQIIPFDKNLLLDFKYDGVEQELSGSDMPRLASLR